MKNDFSLAGSILKWGLIWALGISFLAPLLTWALAPQMFGDGQYGMIFMLTFPLGWIVGVVMASIKSNADSTVPTGGKASAIAAAVTGLGCLILPIGGMLFAMWIFATLGAAYRAFIA